MLNVKISATGKDKDNNLIYDFAISADIPVVQFDETQNETVRWTQHLHWDNINRLSANDSNFVADMFLSVKRYTYALLKAKKCQKSDINVLKIDIHSVKLRNWIVERKISLSNLTWNIGATLMN